MARLLFRILNADDVSAQSVDSVHMFACFRGHDSRFVLEQNVGHSVLGDNSTCWLYQQTKELSENGVKLTYSGDQPFLPRLVSGITTDNATEYPSKIPMYLSQNYNPEPLEVHPVTKQRTDVEVDFRSAFPKMSLIYFTDITSVTIDHPHCQWMVNRIQI